RPLRHRYPPSHHREAPPPKDDDLHDRYMRTTDTWRAHRTGCTTCQHGTPCEAGAPLAQRFERLQDAYLNRRRT
ncbi:hypothetical protein, partial [Streptomyces sp900116325]|uniref:hypothetical protein n=1 Tax=Streptomyces sp. 900116325 TaxID=3154295 RepID=UPI003407C721